MTITADMTFGEIALLPEFAGFGEHLMLCRPSTWERMWNKPIAAHLNSDTNPYEVTRVLRGLNRIVELADDGRQVAYDIWDEADCIRDPTRRNAKLFFFPGRPGGAIRYRDFGWGLSERLSPNGRFSRCSRAQRCGL